LQVGFAGRVPIKSENLKQAGKMGNGKKERQKKKFTRAMSFSGRSSP
jgi:hypothetical protein